MKLSEMIHESMVFSDLPTESKDEVLRRMAKGLAEELQLDFAELFSTLVDRERMSSTGIGSGIAIPHAKLPKCREHRVAVGRSRGGVDFRSIDGKPVHLVFMIVGPMGANEVHLKVLARISRFLHDTNFRDRLITADSAKVIYDAILEKDEQY